MGIDGAYENLCMTIRGMRKVAVAYSGGMDSSFLCRVSHDVLGDNAIAITVVSPMLPMSELQEAKRLTAAIGIRHALLRQETIDPSVAENPAHRCYLCKKIVFSVIMNAAAETGITHVLDGSNLDDLSDYRPGLKALAELGIHSPLRDAGLCKADIRALSRRLGMTTWDKPASACLASRVPYGEKITSEKLGRIDEAESYLRGMGLRQVRVRSHQELARIEAAPDERVKLCNPLVMDDVSTRLRSLGFLYVCLELQGYEAGSMNRTIETKGETASE
jgi:pyridinium-3,5-biscarboxylic acid mononucleotide sulfurtransferase